MKLSIKKGVNFGLTSGIITTLGLIIGLQSSTRSKIVVLAGILTIAIADALSDALGVHMSEESGSIRISDKQIWETTFSTFFSKLFFALTFLIPVLLLDLNLAVIVSIVWGLLLLSISSYYIAIYKKNSPTKVILEHLTISVVVILASKYVGSIIHLLFNSFL